MKRTLLLYLFVTNFSFAFVLNSGVNKVHLIELYTSESCSSCPPAEEFISGFKDSKDLWKRVIPMAFHVSYWNHLNWRDKFSKKEFSRRQRVGARKIKSSVYTPQLLLNGVDIPNNSILDSIKKDESVGNLNVDVSSKFDLAKIKFDSKLINKDTDYFCHSAVLVNGSRVKVTSGENSGKILKEDFIVKDEFKMKAIKNKKSLSCNLNIKLNEGKRQSLVFWIVDSTSNKIIQAVGRTLKNE